MSLEFAPIDTAVCCETPVTEHNIRLIYLAEKEYFERLSALQEELKQKYNPQFIKASLQTTLDKEQQLVATSKIYNEIWGISP